MSVKMQDELVSELQAATRELLDFGHVRQASSSNSPSPRRPTNSINLPRVTYSPNAKLELLHSPTEVRPPAWPSAQVLPAHRCAEQSDQLLYKDGAVGFFTNHDDEDDSLPSRGLSGRIESVKAGHSHLSPSFNTDVYLHPDHKDTTEGSPVDAFPGSSSKLRIATPVNDIYINQYGERVVNGKVVGKTIGGRPRQVASGQVSSGLERVSKTSPAISDSPRFENGESPPAFFLESFPGTPSPNVLSISLHPDTTAGPPLQAPRAVSRPLLLAPPDDEEEALSKDLTPFRSTTDTLSISDNDNDNDVASVSDSAEDALKNFTDVNLRTPVDESPAKAKLPPTRDAFGLLTLRPPLTISGVNREESDPVILHGNKRQARASGGGDSTNTGTVNERAASPFLLPILSKRVESLFSPPRTTKTPTDNVLNHTDTQDNKDLESTSSMVDTARAEPIQATEREAESHSKTPAKINTDDEAASLESSSSSLLSLPVSLPSHASGTSSLERRRSGDAGKPRRRSRRSDQSAYPDDNFARDVRIRGWSEVGSQARGWVVFEILIVTKQGTPITILKRFSSFVTLRKQLSLECADQSKWLPTLPSKSTGILRKYDAKHLEKRRKDLQRWLEVVMLDKVWGCSESLRNWVLSSE